MTGKEPPDPGGMQLVSNGGKGALCRRRGRKRKNEEHLKGSGLHVRP